ncbi:hypothetical protein GGC64_002456 [Mycobacterium sp. OAS707]|uniref:DUF7159 family protein n=1 Tax=unclassified Mycobacterium TaxID=2642494 RepID=UPI001788FD5B|nr:hypothetical protein [Mycobacterium sp. OAS707]MBE1548432.1 hypothetical protein [Mycobacterium sp. OAS707]
MDAVLGLSVTPSAVGLVLVEGQDADGATVDRDAFEVGVRGRCSALQTSEQAAAAVLRSEAIAATHGHRLHSIGVTWSDDANAEASLLLKSLSDSGFDNVVAVRLPEATEALARGIAEVIGYGTTAVCVLEPETVIALIVHLRDGSVQTSVNRRIVTEEDLVRWLSTLFTRADWQPEALVMVGSGGDDELMPILERALSVPVFAPAEAQLALARGAAMASAQNVESSFVDEAHQFEAHHFEQQKPEERRRRPRGQTGPLALLVAGVLTFTVSASVAVSLQLVPKKETASSEPQPAAKVSPEPPAVVTQMQAPLPVTPPVVEPPSEVVPAEAPPTPASSETPVGLPDVTGAAAGEPPVEAVPADPAAAPPPESAPLAPEQLPPPVAPVTTERPGIISRIRDRLHRDDEGAPAADAPLPAAPAEPLPAPPPGDAPPVLPPG